MKEGDIVKEKVTGWEIVIIRKAKWHEQGDWFCKRWTPHQKGGGQWEYENYWESELTEE